MNLLSGLDAAFLHLESPEMPMHVIRQNNPCDDVKWMRQFGRTHRMSKQINMTHQKISIAPLRQIHRKEKRAARKPVASILRHLFIP